MTENVENRLRDYILDNYGKDIEDPKTELKDYLNLDSLDIVEMTLDIEELFDIEIKDEEFENTHTFEELLELIESKLEEGSYE